MFALLPIKLLTYGDVSTIEFDDNTPYTRSNTEFR